MLQRILVSACLMGERVRYDGKVIPYHHIILSRWKKENRILAFCPEVCGGLPVPRSPAEIIAGDGDDVINGNAKVVNIDQKDVTERFMLGAKKVLETIKNEDIKVAVLKERSPSCGSKTVYDGSFSKRLIPGKGITTALLERNGIRIFNENEIERAHTYLLEIMALK